MSDCLPSTLAAAEAFKASGRRLVIAWNGLPVYGAWQIRAVKDLLGGQVRVVATRPDVPAQGMEDIIGDTAHWIESDRKTDWDAIGLPVPDVLIQTGWAYLPFNHLGEQVRANGGQVVAMVDNCWKGNLRQWLGAVKFRLVYKSWFWGVFVPGASGRKLCRFLGMPDSRIFEGVYGVNPELFQPGRALSERPKRFIFIGRMIERKGLLELIEAFRAFQSEHNEWQLIAYGDGPLAERLALERGVVVNRFAPSSEIASALRESRVLVLPSREDHWPLVVHEATSSGCATLLSNQVGNRFEFARGSNGKVVSAGDAQSIIQALNEFADYSGEEWDHAYGLSLQAAENFGPHRFANQVVDIVTQIINK